jgi:hypothetical protein
LRERLSREEWNLGIIRQSVADIVRRGIVQPVAWLDQTDPWHGFADPGCHITADGSRMLYAERTNYWHGRGEIWYAEVPPGVGLGTVKFRRWATANTHLSYPFPFSTGSDLCITMETGSAGQLCLWRYRRGEWLQSVMLDRPAIDPTLWRERNSWWLFCTFADAPDERLHLFHAERVEGPWVPHPGNPIKSDRGSSRPAGPLFRAGGRLIRPSQDCAKSYGGAIVLNEITELTATGYQEHEIRRLTPQSEYPDGLHTLCPAGENITIVDGKRWGFTPIDPLRYMMTGGIKRYRRLRHRGLSIRFFE